MNWFTQKDFLNQVFGGKRKVDMKTGVSENTFNMTSIRIAVRRGNVSALESLIYSLMGDELEYREILNQVMDNEGWTPLGWASFAGLKKIVAVLLRFGASPVVKCKDKLPIVWAIEQRVKSKPEGEFSKQVPLVTQNTYDDIIVQLAVRMEAQLKTMI